MSKSEELRMQFDALKASIKRTSHGGAVPMARKRLDGEDRYGGYP